LLYGSRHQGHQSSHRPFHIIPNRTKSEGGQQDIAFLVYAETRNMIEEAVLEEYEKVVGR
jgi:DNA-binding cell septation regulator SpoVG